jgi:hypothetical protein
MPLPLPQDIYRFDDRETYIYPGNIQIGTEASYQFLSTMPTNFSVATNVSGATFLKGQAIGRGSADTGYDLAASGALETQAIGLACEFSIAGQGAIIQLAGPFCLQDWTAITGTAQLLPRTTYYLSDIPGMLTSVAPTGTGQRVGFSISPLVLNINMAVVNLGPFGPYGPFSYRADTTNTGASDPGAGFIRWNNAVQTSATKLFVDWLTADGFDAHLFYELAATPARLMIQDEALAPNYQLWNLLAYIPHVDWFEVDVSLDSIGSTGLMTKNKRCAGILLTT